MVLKTNNVLFMVSRFFYIRCDCRKRKNT